MIEFIGSGLRSSPVVERGMLDARTLRVFF